MKSSITGSGEIINHGVWLYYRFTLSYRDVQELLVERGIDVTYEAIRKWCLNSAKIMPINCTAGGLGLGLPLVRAIVAEHGGTVTAQSDGEGKGSHFIVRLPVRPSAPNSS